MKSIIILGSTGSIGTNTLDIVQRFPDEFRVVGLTAGGNIDKLEAQIRSFKPKAVAVSTESSAAALRTRCAGLPVEILAGEDGISQVAAMPGKRCLTCRGSRCVRSRNTLGCRVSSIWLTIARLTMSRGASSPRGS